MKKLAYSISVLLAVIACSKEADICAPETAETDGEITFSATMDDSTDDEDEVDDEDEDDVETKVRISKKNKVKWTEGDCISILDINTSPANSKFTLTSGAGKKKGTFDGSCPFSEEGYFAVYPYSSKTYLERYSATAMYPDIWWDGSAQTAYDSQIDPEKHIMVALGQLNDEETEVSLKFKNVLAYLKFTIDYACKSVEVQTGNPEEYIACSHLEVEMDTLGKPVLRVASSRTDKITLNASDGDAIGPGTYYIGILPKTYTQGFKMTFTSTDDDERTVVKSKSDSCTFERSKIYNLGTIDIKEASSLDGDGTEDNPYLIEDFHDLTAMSYLVSNNVGNYPSAFYKQTQDIDCGSQSLTAIGSSTYFSGSYDGQSHTISNLVYAENIYTNYKYYSLFGFIRNATIKNLNIAWPTYKFTGDGYWRRTVSPLVAYALSKDGTNQITDCHVSSEWKTVRVKNIYDLYYGGIIAFNESQLIISNCSSSINLEIEAKSDTWNDFRRSSILDDGYRQYVGGILGYTSGEKNSDPSRNEATENAYTYVTNCRNSGGIVIEHVLGKSYIGGIAGLCEDSNGDGVFGADGDVCPRIGLCVNTGDLSVPGYSSWDYSNSDIYLGGIVGYLDSDGFWSGTSKIDPVLSCCLFKGYMRTGWYYYNVGGIAGAVYDDDTQLIACVNAGHNACAAEKYSPQYAIAQVMSYGDSYSPVACYSLESWKYNSFCTVTSDLTSDDLNAVTGGIATWSGKISDGSLDIVF